MSQSMPGLSKKMVPLMILEILREETDGEHHLTQKRNRREDAQALRNVGGPQSGQAQHRQPHRHGVSHRVLEVNAHDAEPEYGQAGGKHNDVRLLVRARFHRV